MMAGFIEPFELGSPEPDYHATYSIQLCELVNEGFDPFGDERWPNLAWYDSETRARLEDKIQARFWYREIGIMPPGIWRHELTRVMGEVLPKYRPLYAALARGSSILADSDTYEKERHVWSDFPATQLDNETEDYAKSAEDREHEVVQDGNWLEKAQTIASRYNDVDVMVLDELERCFDFQMTMSTNGL